MLSKSGSHAQKLPSGLKFEIFSVAEGYIKRSSQFFQRLLSLPRFTDSESRTGEDKELCSRSASSRAESKLSFHESLLSFLHLASIAAPFSITFLFHDSISQTFRLQFWLCPASSIDDLSICFCRNSSWRREGVGAPSTRKEEKPKQVSPLPPSHPQNKHNPPGISCFNICGGEGMIHSFFQDITGTVWSVRLFPISL